MSYEDRLERMDTASLAVEAAARFRHWLEVSPEESARMVAQAVAGPAEPGELLSITILRERRAREDFPVAE